ncbi:uncharacterized protein NPIL_180281 [Nephila pilipes]|uniref:Mos1 transposase HTH domain-containing protein n=1 Tax=Nephila pilipes TaxID=299642 RepID=A0A8X6QP12_NEPPI|nr:uncharacterized protein NPIL_180281 [Nephila pilipes]
MELNREHFRAIIFHNFRRGLSRQECFDELNSLYSDKAPSYSTVKNWYNEFNRGRCSIQDESRAGRPKSVVVPEKINAVRELIKQDRHVTYREIEAFLDISMTSINKILHEHLSVKKICSRWIPHNLTNAQKKARVDWCKEMLEKYIQGTSKAVYNIYTGDESWIYAYEPETKQQSTVWVFQDEAKPTKVVRGRSTSKQMIACFFGINGHVATVALEQRRTVNSEWYTTICLPEVRIVRGWDWSKLSIFTELRQLSITDVSMKRLSVDFKPNITKKLKVLMLSWCSIKKFRANEFEEFKDLEIFTASHDEISEIKRTMFSRPSSLKQISFEYNKISRIPEDMFEDMSDLMFINLSHNLISVVPQNAFRSVIEHLTYFYLQDNPIKCDCLIHWLTFKKIPNFYGICESPKKFHGRNIATLRPQEFRC